MRFLFYFIYIIWFYYLFYQNLYIGDNTFEILYDQQQQYLEDTYFDNIDKKYKPIYSKISKKEGFQSTKRIALFYQSDKKIYPIMFEDRASALFFYPLMFLNKILNIKDALFLYLLIINLIGLVMLEKVLGPNLMVGLPLFLMDPILTFSNQPYIAESFHKIFAICLIYLINKKDYVKSGILLGFSLFSSIKVIWILLSVFIIFFQEWKRLKIITLKILKGFSIPGGIYLLLINPLKILETWNELGVTSNFFTEINSYSPFYILYDLYDLFLKRDEFTSFFFNQSYYISRLNDFDLNSFIPNIICLVLFIIMLLNAKHNKKFFLGIFIYVLLYYLSLPKYFGYSKYMGEISLLYTFILYNISLNNKILRYFILILVFINFTHWSFNYKTTLKPTGLKSSRTVSEIVKILPKQYPVYIMDNDYVGADSVGLYKKHKTYIVRHDDNKSIEYFTAKLKANYLISMDNEYSSWHEEIKKKKSFQFEGYHKIIKDNVLILTPK